MSNLPAWLETLSDPSLRLKAELAFWTGRTDESLDSVGHLVTEIRRQTIQHQQGTLVIPPQIDLSDHFTCQVCNADLLSTSHHEWCSISMAYRLLNPSFTSPEVETQTPTGKRRTLEQPSVKSTLPRRLPIPSQSK
jgi:hypothetical protein